MDHVAVIKKETHIRDIEQSKSPSSLFNQDMKQTMERGDLLSTLRKKKQNGVF